MEKQFALALKSVEGLWDWNLATGELYLAPAWRDMLGLPRDGSRPFAISDWFNRLHPDDREWVLASIEGTEGVEESFEIEYRIRDKDRTWRWMRCRGMVQRDEQGRMVRAAGSQTDITQRKHHEEAARQSQERFTLAVKAANDGLWDWDMQTGQVYLGNRWRAMSGLPPSDGKFARIEDWFERVHPDDLDWLMASIEGTEGPEGSFELEYRLDVAGKGWRWMLCRGIVMRDSEGRPVRAAGSQSNVHRRKKEEAAFNAMRNYTESILKSLTSAVITLDRSFRLERANTAAIQLLEVSDEADLVGRPLDGLFEQAEWLSASVEKVRATGERDTVLDQDLRAVKSGRTVSVNLTTVPLSDLMGDSLGYMLIMDDLSREKRIKSTMARYVPKDVMDKVLESGEDNLGGSLQLATVMFSDIRKFSTLAERLGPRASVSMLNDYFSAMADVILAHHGVLDKYIGDAIMVLFGAPLSSPQDADNAVAAANDMMRTMAILNQRPQSEHPPLDIGIGIATGQVIAGNIGSVKRMDYTVIGDSVNLAARLETATKYYGAHVILDEVTVQMLERETLMRELDIVQVKGKVESSLIFEALDYHTEASFPHLPEVLGIFAEGLAAYRRRSWNVAVKAFDACLALNPADRPSALYQQRCRDFLVTQPADDWDGVWVLPAG